MHRPAGPGLAQPATDMQEIGNFPRPGGQRVGQDYHSTLCTPGIAEGRREDLLLASTLNQPDQTGRVLLRCLNCSDQTLNIAAGSVVGELVAVREEDVQDDAKGPTHVQAQQYSDSEVPSHLLELYAQAGSVLPEPAQRQAVAHLLQEYESVFSRGEDDVGLTDQVQHKIPLVPGAHPSSSRYTASGRKRRPRSSDKSKGCSRKV